MFLARWIAERRVVGEELEQEGDEAASVQSED
jgi:hypothetical protein